MWFQTTLLLAAVCLTLGAIIPEDVERIVGGQNTTVDQFPWQVSVQNITTGRHFCGGTIINPTTILTAAHCVAGDQAAEVRVRAGSTYHNDSGIFRSVGRIASHDNYNRNTTDFDIALLILTDPLVYTPSVQPANLPEFEYDLENNVTVEVSGWGTLRSGNRTLSSNLQFVQIQTVDQEACREAYRNMNGTSAEITDNMFCAGAPGGGKDSCQGDSGGPVVERTTGRPTIVQGIVSWGYQCGLPSHPGVYTRVSRFLNWIAENQ